MAHQLIQARLLPGLFVFAAWYTARLFWAQVVEKFAKVAELVDALDLGSSGVSRESSSLSFRTISCIPAD